MKVIHSMDAECTIFSGFVKLGDAHVFITALNENRITGDQFSIPCIWWSYAKSSFIKEFNFSKYNELAANFARDIVGQIWHDAHLKKPDYIFLRAIVISDSSIFNEERWDVVPLGRAPSTIYDN